MTAPVDLLARFERKYRKPKAGRTLIVGSHVYEGKTDRRKLYPDAIGVDLIDGPGVDLVRDMETDPPIGPFDHIECRSVLEHSKRPWRIAQNLEEMLAPGGTLDITVPFCWRVHAYPSDYWRFTTDAVRLLFPNIEWKALRYANNRLTEGFKARKQTVDGTPYFPRTEVYGFGVRK